MSEKQLRQSIQNFSNLPDEAFVNQKTVEVILGVSPATVWRWANSGLIPKPKRIGVRKNGWQVGELRQMMLERMRENGG